MQTAAMNPHPAPASSTGSVPDRETFCRLASQGNLIPVYKELLADCDTPVSAFYKLNPGKYAYLLESVAGGEQIGRYSFVGASASLVFRSRGTAIEVERPDGTEWYEAEDPLAALEAVLTAYRPVHVPGLPRFYGGAVGYLAYDMVRHFQSLPTSAPDPLELPESCFLFTDTLLIFDHVRRKLQVVVNAHVDGDPGKAYDAAVATIEETIAKLRSDVDLQPLETPSSTSLDTLSVESNFTREEYMAAVQRAKEYIEAGDVQQVVLSQRFSIPMKGDTFNLYRVLRTVNPSPYMFYLRLGESTVVGSSPETLVRVEDGEATLRPIAGTRRRGSDPAEDLALEQELLADEKERAEHMMLVDLGRAELSRVCTEGTVEVAELMAIERYSHVMHIVSSLRGTLAPDRNAFDVLRAAFPAGTLSGAPKVRAMEIIDELEPIRRGVYGGAVAYFGFSGNMDSCITIRSVVVHRGRAYVQAGAGIVADSDPAREYEETTNKARGMLTAIALSEGAHERRDRQ